jgi:Transposase DDE domain
MARKIRVRNNRFRGLHRKKTAPLTNGDSFKELCDWFLPDDGIFSHIKFHGNIKWTPVFLVWLGLFWAWMDARFLTDAFTEARDCCQKIFGCMPLKSYPSFIWALVGQTANFIPVLRETMQQRMEQIGGKFWRVEGWVPIAFDGSRSSAPRTTANEKSLCAVNYGKGKTAKYRKKKSKGMRRKQNEKNKAAPPKPQAWITMLWHMSLRLPWSWRLGRSDSSERDHAMEMVREETFPKNTLLCGDAGFVGYSFWACLLEQGCDFLIRVGANVNLLLEQTDYTVEKTTTKKDKLVLCWPKTMQAKQPPLRLRLVQIRLGKKSPAWILTSVRDPERLSAPAILRLYQMRWGIEVEFRGLKQTLDRAKLRSRNDRNLLAELNWSILAMAVAELFALKEQLTQRTLKKSKEPTKPIDPIKRSLAETMRAIRSCLRNSHGVPEVDHDLASKLRAATTDDYHRKSSKQARYRPKNPDKKKLGEPDVRRLSTKEKHKLRQIPELQAA